MAFMSVIDQRIQTRRLLVLAYLLTLPAILFWLAVGVSLFLNDQRLINAFMTPGAAGRVIVTFLMPFLSFLIAVYCRANLRRKAIAMNLWHRETDELRANQGLINWSVVLMGIMFISLINN
jgi:hypothetical protein